MLYIRADMNEIIATGHIMRCLSIADAARELGEETTFLLADTQAEELLKSKGYKYIVLNTRWKDMESELDILKEIILEQGIKTLLIDSYQVTERYLEELTKLTRTIYLDDVNAFHYPVNGIICYANYHEKFQYRDNYPDIELYEGLQYAPLRKEFSDCQDKPIKEKIENLLLLSGGSDNYHILKGILERIECGKYQQIHVICGKYNVDYDELCTKYKNIPNVCIHKTVTDMKHYMEQADFVVTAGGSTLYEVCTVGTPAISYSFADNQLDNVKQFQQDGIIEYAGDIRTEDIFENIKIYLEKYHLNKVIRQKVSKKMQSLIDGRGAMRIANAIINLQEK